MTICWDYLAALLIRVCATVLKKSWEWFLGKSEKHFFGFWVQFPEMGVPLFPGIVTIWIRKFSNCLQNGALWDPILTETNSNQNERHKNVSGTTVVHTHPKSLNQIY